MEENLLFPPQVMLPVKMRRKPFELLTFMRNRTKAPQGKGPLVAIDLGSGMIRAMAAEVNPDGTLHILGVEEVSKSRAMQKGIIENSSEVSASIRQILTLLRNRIGMRSDEIIQSAFVSVGGHKLQTVTVQASRDLLSYSYIPEKRYKEMEEECKTKLETRYPEIVVFGVEPILYILDDEAQTEKPTENQKAHKITIQYNAFICSKDCMDGITGSTDRAALAVEKHFSKSEVLATALCQERDLHEGVAIIDMGYQTTTLSIYKEGRCRMTYVVPRGGYHITRDIQDMQISMNDAEKAKIRFGSALESCVSQTRTLSIRSAKDPNERVQLSTPLLARIIEAQLRETFAPIMQRLSVFQSGATLAKIYLTGGGAMLRDIIPFMETLTTLPVEYGSHYDWLEESTDEVFDQPDYASLVGTLLLGDTYRKEHEDEQPKKPKIPTFTETIINIFTQG